MASALRDFRDAKGNEGDWVGAIALAQLAADVSQLNEAVIKIGTSLGVLQVRK